MKRIKLVYNNCPRCGSLMVGLDRSLSGCESGREKYKGLCEDCATKEEKLDILNIQSVGILNKGTSNGRN